MKEFGTEMYDRKYESKEETNPRSIVTYFVDTYLKSGQNCLDLGSGAGRHSKYLAEKGVVVTAIDLSAVGIEKTTEILKDFPGSQALVGDIHVLPFEAESFDSLVCNRVFDYNDDAGLEVAISQIARVLKKEATALVTVRSTTQQPKDKESIVCENTDGGKTFQVTGTSQMQHYFTKQEIENLAEKHGFKILAIREDLHTNSENEEKAEWQFVLQKN